MKVILRKDVESVGEAGDVVEVANGYARNYLLPSSAAEVATPGALKNRERNIERIKAKAEKLHQDALVKAEKIQSLEQFELQAKSGESGKLFGAITTRRLAEEILEKSGVEVDRRNIGLNNPINQLGEYQMKVKLSSKVSFSMPIIVVASEIIKEEVVEEVIENQEQEKVEEESTTEEV